MADNFPIGSVWRERNESDPERWWIVIPHPSDPDSKAFAFQGDRSISPPIDEALMTSHMVPAIKIRVFVDGLQIHPKV